MSAPPASRFSHVSGARAFTLLELIVGLAIGLGVVAVAMSLVVGTMSHVRHSRALAQLHRDGAFAGRLLEQDLRHAGLGVPPGPHIVTTSLRLVPMIVAASTEIGVVGDLARPDAQYNTFGPLHGRPTRGRDVRRGGGEADSVAWHTENNGSCMPGAPGDPCQVNRTSVFFPSNDASQSCTVSPDDRTCPWGVRRVRPGDELQIVAADKTWATSRATDGTLAMMGPLPADNAAGLLAAPVSLRLAELIEPPPRQFTQVFRAQTPNPVRWRNMEPGTMPGGSVGQGFVTTLDRVFWFQIGPRLLRVQCWTRPAPDAPGWPSLGAANAVPTSIRAETAGAQCTPAETVARDVESVRFRYFDANDVEITGDARLNTRRVEFEIALTRTTGVGGARQPRHVVTGSVALQNS